CEPVEHSIFDAAPVQNDSSVAADDISHPCHSSDRADAASLAIVPALPASPASIERRHFRPTYLRRGAPCEFVRSKCQAPSAGADLSGVRHDEVEEGAARRPSYPAFLRPLDRSGLAAFFSAGFCPSIGRSISFWPAVALRGFLPLLVAASVSRLFFRASIRSTTFPPLGRGLGPTVLP